MTELVLSFGDTIAVTLEDTDGQFEIKYDGDGISIWSEMPDQHGRDNIIYHEPFMGSDYWSGDYSDEHLAICEGIESEGMLYYFQDYMNTETIKDPGLRYLASEFVYLANRIKEHIEFKRV